MVNVVGHVNQEWGLGKGSETIQHKYALFLQDILAI